MKSSADKTKKDRREENAMDFRNRKRAEPSVDDQPSKKTKTATKKDSFLFLKVCA